MKEWRHETTCKMCGKISMSRYNDICNACYMRLWRAEKKRKKSVRNLLSALVIVIAISLITYSLASLTYMSYLAGKCRNICKPYNYDLKNGCCYCLLEVKEENYRVVPSSWEVGSCER